MSPVADRVDVAEHCALTFLHTGEKSAFCLPLRERGGPPGPAHGDRRGPKAHPHSELDIRARAAHALRQPTRAAPNHEDLPRHAVSGLLRLLSAEPPQLLLLCSLSPLPLVMRRSAARTLSASCPLSVVVLAPPAPPSSLPLRRSSPQVDLFRLWFCDVLAHLQRSTSASILALTSPGSTPAPSAEAPPAAQPAASDVSVVQVVAREGAETPPPGCAGEETPPPDCAGINRRRCPS